MSFESRAIAERCWHGAVSDVPGLPLQDVLPVLGKVSTTEAQGPYSPTTPWLTLGSFFSSYRQVPGLNRLIPNEL